MEGVEEEGVEEEGVKEEGVEEEVLLCGSLRCTHVHRFCAGDTCCMSLVNGGRCPSTGW